MNSTQPLHFCAFVMNTPSHIIHGLWRDPEGDQIRFNELDLWTDLAVRLEDGGFDAIFFADVVGLYHDFRGGPEFHAELGLQIPSNDPMVILSALAARTEHLGLAFTFGIAQEPPFQFARQVSTLDHVSNGRIAWNIVTGALPNGWRNLGWEEMPEHDSRYSLADEYLDVVYKLWEGSWEEDALLADRGSGLHADPSKIHRIDHVSEHYRVEGPFLVTPSPQRTPLLFQAGSSPVGRDFAARHAEAQFIQSPSPDDARRQIEETRDLVQRHGRRREDLKFFQGLSFVVGSTEAEARAKERELEEKIDVDGMVAHMGGGIGVDLGGLDPDDTLDAATTEGVQGILKWLRESAGGGNPTVRDVMQLMGRRTRVVGTPEQIADQLASYRAAGVDGVNVINATIPGSYQEFIDQVMPELRRRGLAADGYAEGTLRRKLFGHDRLSERHPAARYRGAFAATPASV
ncbi:MAG TPA: NtaA/DmoA family FMN-dependent monooxygenase [Solirubrobacterales bacterium]|nr:NtaA/DmoA family FMN-dependent monooxygenase [Solirubrobacterales bacterium]